MRSRQRRYEQQPAGGLTLRSCWNFEDVYTDEVGTNNLLTTGSPVFVNTDTSRGVSMGIAGNNGLYKLNHAGLVYPKGKVAARISRILDANQNIISFGGQSAGLNYVINLIARQVADATFPSGLDVIVQVAGTIQIRYGAPGVLLIDSAYRLVELESDGLEHTISIDGTPLILTKVTDKPTWRGAWLSDVPQAIHLGVNCAVVTGAPANASRGIIYDYLYIYGDN